MNRIMAFFKKIFTHFKKNNTKTSDDVESYNERISKLDLSDALYILIEKYDIVWVKMLESDIKSKNIPLGHRERPFVVTSKNDDTKTFSGYYFSSNIYNNRFNLTANKIVLDKENYGFKKDSIIYLDEKTTLELDNLDHFMGHIADCDLKNFCDMLTLNDIGCIGIDDDTFIDIGYVVTNDFKKMIITRKENDEYYGYDIYKDNHVSKSMHDNILINKKWYRVDYGEEKQIDLKEYNSLIGRTSNLMFNKVINGINRKTNINIGDIVSFNDKDYIIHQTDNTNYYGYRISKVKEKMTNTELRESFNHIKVKYDIFYIDYEDNYSFKNDTCVKKVGFLSEDVVDKIRKNKTEIKHRNKVLKKKNTNRKS